MSRRRLRVLFFVENPAAFWRYAPLVAELAGRGHTVRLAFDHVPKGMVEELAPGVAYGPAPRRGRFDGWRPLANAVRRLADLARYAHPRYADASFLRERMASAVIGDLQRRELEPLARGRALRLARRLAGSTDAALSERVIAAMARYDRAIPTSGEIDAFVRDERPDVVLVTPIMKAPSQVEYLKSARKAGVPTAACVKSWDQLTNRGLLRFVPERVLVWNERQRVEAQELHGIPPERVVATGAQQFDEWFERRPSTTREEFLRRVGLDPAEGYVLYLCSSPDITRPARGERAFVESWIEAVRGSGDELLERIGILVRPHPNPAATNQWRRADLARFGNAVVWPSGGARPVGNEASAGFFDSLSHSEAVVGINTTSMIEAAIAGKSVLTIRAPQFAQESTLHFHHLLAENGGFLHVAESLEEHAGQLARVLEHDPEDDERRRAFVQAFVRPQGLDRPATPILADAVEETATLPVDPFERGPLGLRAALAAEATMSRLAMLAAAFPTRERKGFRREKAATGVRTSRA
ncbi:MAG: hypothetical protein ACM3QU_00720 [Verrucomicrobiota bacterium]